jgi:hypothetical protein
MRRRTSNPEEQASVAAPDPELERLVGGERIVAQHSMEVPRGAPTQNYLDASRGGDFGALRPSSGGRGTARVGRRAGLGEHGHTEAPDAPAGGSQKNGVLERKVADLVRSPLPAAPRVISASAASRAGRG